MKPQGRGPHAYKDAVFISPHKFIGGPGTPGVLVVKRQPAHEPRAPLPGGGTVAYVNAGASRYIVDPVHREEGGTPAIIESIRAGLVFQLKDAVGRRADPASARSRSSSRAIESWSTQPEHPHPRQPRRRGASRSCRS